MKGKFHRDYTYILLLVRHNRAITSKGHDLFSDIYFDILHLVNSYYLLRIKKSVLRNSFPGLVHDLTDLENNFFRLSFMQENKKKK